MMHLHLVQTIQPQSWSSQWALILRCSEAVQAGHESMCSSYCVEGVTYSLRRVTSMVSRHAFDQWAGRIRTGVAAGVATCLTAGLDPYYPRSARPLHYSPPAVHVRQAVNLCATVLYRRDSECCALLSEAWGDCTEQGVCVRAFGSILNCTDRSIWHGLWQR